MLMANWFFFNHNLGCLRIFLAEFLIPVTIYKSPVIWIKQHFSYKIFPFDLFNLIIYCFLCASLCSPHTNRQSLTTNIFFWFIFMHFLSALQPVIRRDTVASPFIPPWPFAVHISRGDLFGRQKIRALLVPAHHRHPLVGCFISSPKTSKNIFPMILHCKHFLWFSWCCIWLFLFFFFHCFCFCVLAVFCMF